MRPSTHYNSRQNHLDLNHYYGLPPEYSSEFVLQSHDSGQIPRKQKRAQSSMRAKVGPATGLMSNASIKPAVVARSGQIATAHTNASQRIEAHTEDKSALEDIPSQLSDFIKNLESYSPNTKNDTKRISKFGYFNPKHPLKYLKTPKLSVKTKTQQAYLETAAMTAENPAKQFGTQVSGQASASATNLLQPPVQPAPYNLLAKEVQERPKSQNMQSKRIPRHTHVIRPQSSINLVSHSRFHSFKAPAGSNLAQSAVSPFLNDRSGLVPGHRHSSSQP